MQDAKKKKETKKEELGPLAMKVRCCATLSSSSARSETSLSARYARSVNENGAGQRFI